MLRRNLIANYLGQGWAALMGLAFIPVYVRYLGIEAFGLIGIFSLLQVWLGLLDMGMKPTLNREMARFAGGSHTVEFIRDLLRSIEVATLGLAVLTFAGVALASNWLAASWLRAESLPVPVVAQTFAIMGAITALRFLEGIYGSSLLGLQRQVAFNLITACAATLRGVGAVAVLVWVAPTLTAFFLWQGLASLASLAVMAVVTYASLPNGSRRGHCSIAALRSVWRFAGGMLGIAFLTLILTQVDKILLSRLLTLGEYGYYALAAAVAGGLYMLVSPITQAWFPRLNQLQLSSDPAALIRTYHQGAQLVSVILGSVAVVLIVHPESILSLWTQNPELAQRTAPLLRLLALGNLLNGLMWIPYQTQLAYGWTGLTIRINVVAVLLIVPAILWTTPRYGSEGAALVWVVLNAGYLLVGVHFMYRRILSSEKWRWYREDVMQPLLAGATVALALEWVLPAPIGVIRQAAVLVFSSGLVLIAAALAAPCTRQYLRTGMDRLLVASRSG